MLTQANAARAVGININALTTTGSSFYNFETAPTEAQCYGANLTNTGVSCLPRYAREFIVGSTGFVEQANTFTQFAAAAQRKLEREIPSPFSAAALLPLMGLKKLRDRYKARLQAAAAAGR